MRRQLAALRAEADDMAAFAAWERQQLELRIVALEEIVAARQPRSAVLRRRLARQLRDSVRHVQGEDFQEKRTESASVMMTPPRWAGRPGGGNGA